MERRLHIYMYSLVYPAVLGSFLFAAITRTGLDHVQVWAALLMGVYFHVQYAEGLLKSLPEDPAKPSAYSLFQFVQDMLEVIALVAVFAALGFFETAPALPGAPGAPVSPSRLGGLVGWHWPAMIVAFLIPPLGRWLGRRRASPPPEAKARSVIIGGELSVLSFAAVLGCGFAWALEPVAGLMIVTGAMGFYLLDYVLCWRMPGTAA